MHIMAFDIETVPDVTIARRLWDMEGIDDADVAKALATRYTGRSTKRGFLPLHLHRVVAISVMYSTPTALKLSSLGEVDASEQEIITAFFQSIDKKTPLLVSWNGGGFDLPVLHYRAMHHGVVAPRYWEVGDSDKDFRFNNYLNRYHRRHVDLMDVLASYNPSAWISLQDAATLIGLPGKMGMQGQDVWQEFLAGHVGDIRDYCEIDALNTYLLFVRWQWLSGQWSDEEWRAQCTRVRDYLAEDQRAHVRKFLNKWPAC